MGVNPGYIAIDDTIWEIINDWFAELDTREKGFLNVVNSEDFLKRHAEEDLGKTYDKDVQYDIFL